MPAETPTWMQAIRDAGYRTSLFGKTHVHNHKGDLRDRENLMHAYGLQDVDEIGGPRASANVLSHMTAKWQEKGLWKAYQEDYKERFSNKPYVVRPSTLPLEEYADVYVGQQAKNYLADYTLDKPWFCWVSFGGPHEPWDTPEPYASMYKAENMPPALPRTESQSDRPKGHLDRIFEQRGPISKEDIAAMRADYAGNVSLIDSQVGEILSTIEQRGELDNTVIIFSSDHGEMNGDHGLIYKSNFLNSAVRVPLILRTPQTLNNSAAGSVSEALVEWFDIGPTLTELSEGELEHQQFARSLCPLIENTGIQHRKFAVSQIHGEHMILTDSWKMAVNKEGKAYLLYNLHDDPSESRNLAGTAEVSEIENNLCRKLLEHIVSTQLKQVMNV